MPKNLDKKLSIGAATLLVLGVAFGAGLYSGMSRNIVYRAALKFKSTVDTLKTDWQNRIPNGEPVYFLEPARQPGDGVTIDKHPDDGKLILISGYFEGGNEVRLIRRDGTPVAKWPVRILDLFPDLSFTRFPPQTNNNIDTHGALVNPDGSLVFNFDYGGTTKLSRCGDVIWTLPAETHHSVEKSEKGGYWIPTRGFIDPPDFGAFFPLTHPTKKAGFFLYDKIAKVSEDGKIEFEKSVPEILFDNGLAAVLTATGTSFTNDGAVNAELTHVNKIAELPAAYADQFPEFEAGDLLVSLRSHNLLFVVDPDTWKVKWHQTGPWVRQHDPEFDADGTIMVFNNNAYRLSLTDDGQTDMSAPRVSNIMKTDPRTGATEVIYGDRAGEEFLSVIRGKIDPIDGGAGGVLVTEHEAGRVFEVSPDREITWQYINRYDENRVVEVTEAREYPAAYFSVANWSCP